MSIRQKISNYILSLPLLMSVAGAAAAQDGALGFEPPSDDETAGWEFQMLVGEVLDDERAQAQGNPDLEALLRATSYDSSKNHQGRDCAGTPKNQFSCGSCWAFASTAALESAHCQDHGTMHDLAEQTILECRTDIGTTDDRCSGAWEQVAYDVMRSHGLDLETNRPYDGKNFGSCQGPSSDKSFYGIDGTLHLKTQSTGQPSLADIKAAVLKSGAVTVALAVTRPFDNFRAGSRPIVNTDSDLLSVRGLHEVVITGWDDTLGAWRIKNSWGTTSWGEKGFGWLTYNDKSIIGSHFSTVLPKRAYVKDEQARLVNKLVGKVLIEEPTLFAEDPEVQWPTSLGFPEEKLTLNEAISFATQAGLLAPMSSEETTEEEAAGETPDVVDVDRESEVEEQTSEEATDVVDVDRESEEETSEVATDVVDVDRESEEETSEVATDVVDVDREGEDEV